jgi:hypothetical protein
MNSYNYVPKFVLLIGLIVVVALGYDVARPYIKGEKPWPWASAEVVQPKPGGELLPEVLSPQKSLVVPQASDKELVAKLSAELAKGKWGVIVYWPSPQNQEQAHYDVIAAIKTEQGVLHPLAQQSRYCDIIRVLQEDEYDNPPFGNRGYKGCKEEGGGICIWDLKNPDKPLLAYNQAFPYYGYSGEYSDEKWNSSQILASEIATTLKRWNEQSSRLTR